MLISYNAPLPSERLIHCCFAFRNLYLCQGGLLKRTFYHQRRSQAAAKCLSVQHSRSNQCEQSGQLIFCIDLLTRDSSQITFLCPVSPKGALGNAAWSRPNSHSDHALYCDYSASSLLSDEIRLCHHKCYLATRPRSARTVKKWKVTRKLQPVFSNSIYPSVKSAFPTQHYFYTEIAFPICTIQPGNMCTIMV